MYYNILLYYYIYDKFKIYYYIYNNLIYLYMYNIKNAT